MSEEFEFGTFGVSELRFPTTRDSSDDSAPVGIFCLFTHFGADFSA